MGFLRWLKSGKGKTFSGQDQFSLYLRNSVSSGEPDLLRSGYASQVKEAYIKNVVAYRAITSIARCASSISIIIKKKGKDVDVNDEIYRLLKYPNPLESYRAFIQNLLIFRLISGNGYIRMLATDSKKRMEIYTIKPDLVEIETARSDGRIVAYKVRNDGGGSEKIEVDPITFESDVLHVKEPNPEGGPYGLSPIRAAAMGISQHNEAGLWNYNLLKNAAQPSGAMVLDEKRGDALPMGKEQLEELSKSFNEKFSGPKGAGRVPFLSFGMRFEQMSLSPKDMDWINSKNVSAREVALAFGYPPHLLGMAEGSTFNNVAEAKLSLYQETIIPLLSSTLESLSSWLSLKSGNEIEIMPDQDTIDALAPVREAQWEQGRKDFEAGIITLNEAREQRGYDAVPNGDDFLVPANKLPLGFDPSSLDE